MNGVVWYHMRQDGQEHNLWEEGGKQPNFVIETIHKMPDFIKRQCPVNVLTLHPFKNMFFVV